jgi:hypothetical protein
MANECVPRARQSGKEDQAAIWMQFTKPTEL